MLKGKTATYLLIAAVATVWGVIIFRIVGSLGDEEPVAIHTTSAKKAPLDDYAFQPDTTHLLLNYRDPFGKSKAPQTIDTTASGKRERKMSTLAIAAKPEITWPTISYGGYIQNPETKKLIALLHINGRNTMLAEGESADGVILIKNLRDSVRLRYQGKTRSFQQQNANP